MNRHGLQMNQDQHRMNEAGLNQSANYWIERLGLTAHPEGGWYKEVYRSKGIILANSLAEFGGTRNFSTSIYFLLAGNDFSAFHRIRSDEIWHFYDGSPVLISSISPEGILEQHLLGRNIENNESLQVVIPAGWWFAAKIVVPDSFMLAGCAVAPGFDFNDFELGQASELIAGYPQHRDIIAQLTR